MSTVIAVVNQKGGVGKTTTAINLAAAIGEKGRRVLLIDLDPQANSTTGLGVDARSHRMGVYELLIGSATAEQVMVETSAPGVQLIPSRIDLAGAEIELATMSDREHLLRRALEPLRHGGANGPSVIVIDCPPSLGVLTLNALVAADEVLIPSQCEYFALEGLAHIVRTHQLVRSRLNPDLRLRGIVMTQFDARTTLAWDVLAEVRRVFPGQVLKTLIPRNVRLSEAPSHGLPITRYDPACRGTQAYRELAEEVMS